jgi:2-polyprenyl-6-methoxyphenol hydroxylase-like FAD-dependent oxidoreductase
MTTSDTFGQSPGSGLQGGRAIIVGGSITGLLAARALTEHFSSVTLVERDRFPDGPEFRKGLPQMRHVHVLLKQGERVIAHYFPELLAELIAGGAHLIDMGGDLRWFNFGNWKTRFQSGVEFFCQSRGFLEWKIRQRVASLGGVRMLDECDVAGYTLDSTRRISGVKIHRAGGNEDHLDAELVVDASGRGSKTPQWLDQLGFGKPTETEVRVDVGYASRFYHRPAKRPGDWTGLMIYPKPPGTRLGVLLPVEDNRWMVTLVGWFGDHPPTDEPGFLDFAASLPVPDLYRAIKDAELVSPTASHKFPSNRRRHYERMRRFPEGLVVLGDALCSFNPIYGQGMTTGALGVRLLDDSLHDQRRLSGSGTLVDFSHRFQRKIARVIDSPWLLTTTEDFRSPRTAGQRAWWTAALCWYTGRIHRLTWSDRFTARRFLEVMHLTVRPTALFHPYIVFRALTQGFHADRVHEGNGRGVGIDDRERTSREKPGEPR